MSFGIVFTPEAQDQLVELNRYIADAASAEVAASAAITGGVALTGRRCR